MNSSAIRQSLYLVLAIVGLFWAWSHGLPWTITWFVEGSNPANVPLFFYEFFNSAYIASPTAAFLTVDLLGAWFTFLVFVLPEAKRLKMPYGWVYFLVACTLGVCFAMPLFLFFRERTLSNLATA